ncbi:hypothetical protein PG994_000760 [Apiospora phragmitis]|uniref:Lipocalin-like domain-containing protein n=1 Tax=Apiospora phragmitis TaxID=2905665 RepID=A0ABR1X763_9PEZI
MKFSVVGTWLLLNISEINDGVPTFPSLTWGAAPEGVIIYTASGWVSAAIVATEARWRPTAKPHTAADLAVIANHSLAYTGPYAVNASYTPPVGEDPKLGQVVHGPLVVAEDPSIVGTTFMRGFRLWEEGEVLELVLRSSNASSNTSSTLFWERVG